MNKLKDEVGDWSDKQQSKRTLFLLKIASKT